MNAKSLPRRGMHRAFLTLLWLSAASAMGCTQCSPSSIFTRDAGTSIPDAGTDAATSACDVLPDPPDAGPDVPKPCRYWVVDDAINKGACDPIAAPTQPGKSWQGNSMFGGELVPATLHKYCSYEWSDTSEPTDADIAALPTARSANCTYITPQQATPDPFTQWARNELLPPMTERLGASDDIKVRVVVLDTAPGMATTSSPSHHGRTLAQLIRDSACQNAAAAPADCAVEVRTALAMPRIITDGVPQLDSTGGYFGLLSDLTQAVWTETNRYREELQRAARFPDEQKNVPMRVIFNESFGFGNTDAFPNRCGDTPPANDVTTSALFDALMAASCLGVLHVAAAGNHTGGSSHRDGMLCPARWDHAIAPSDSKCEALWGADLWKDLGTQFKSFTKSKTRTQNDFTLFASNAKALRAVAATSKTDSLLSVGGVDYHGSPIVLTRPNACPEAVAIGIGGTSFGSAQEVPPFLFGTSVSAAVASANLAIKWSQQLDGTATDVQLLSVRPTTPFKRDAGLCGGEPIACANNIPWIGKPAATIEGQNSAWPNTRAEALWPSLAPKTVVAMDSAVCLDKLPLCNRPSRAMTADVWPQPVDPVCLKCGIYLPRDTTSYPELWIDRNPNFHAGPTNATLVVENQRGYVVLTRPVSPTSITSSSRTVLSGVDRAMFSNARVWLSGYDSEGRSYSQQIFVDQ